MKKVFKNFLVGFMVFALMFPAFLVSASASDAVTYLESQDQDPWITQALAAAGASSISTDHLTTVSGDLVTDYAKIILALASVGENPKTFGSVDYVAKLKTYADGSQVGDPAWVNDDAWSILALAAVGEIEASETVQAKDFILANQNADGGWGWAVGGTSDSNDTAAAIMALVEAGVEISDAVITNAVNYLETIQNDDGGFGYEEGSESDSGSDAWVISALIKLGQDPTTWDKSGNNPITHLESLQDTDGGYWWVDPATSPEFNNKAMTPYAVIALSGKSYPVGYYIESISGSHYLRIEGEEDTICADLVAGDTAMEVLTNGAQVCDYTYVITESTFGSYVSQINEETAEGMSGWLYFVNFESPSVGADAYVLDEGDEVLWYYGEWGWPPTRFSLSDDTLDSGESTTALVEYYDGETWLPLAEAGIEGSVGDYLTDSSGQVTLSLADGYYTLYVEKEGYVRSNKETLAVGSGVSQSVSLVVEIDQGGHVHGESIEFEISASQLDFGTLSPGEEASGELELTNSGTVDLTVTASVSGASIFTDNLKLESELWPEFSADLVASTSQDVEASLEVPDSYSDSGTKNGELIFWAEPL